MKTQNLRQIYGETLVELGKDNMDIVVLEADLGKSTMTYLFQEKFPERFYEMGIGEQNMVSVAAGLALTGKIAFVNSFAVFATGRAYDQIRQAVCIASLNVKVIGSSAGLSDFGDGATHQSVEDIAIMRAIPNMTVLAPVDGVETRKMVAAICEYNGPVYMRLNRNDLPVVFPEDQPFTIGEPCVLRKGNDITVFAHGVMVSIALKAANMLEQKGISLRVVNVSSLKPINEKVIIQLASDTKGVIIAEEHSVIGGLTEAVAYILRGRAIPIESVSIGDTYGQSAHSYEELLDHYGLTEQGIINSVNSILSED